MKPIPCFGNWIHTKDQLPPNDLQVIVKIDYSPDAKYQEIAVMYRQDNDWFFVGQKPNPYGGKYIKYWLKDLVVP